jgi:hypothetical protein
VYHNSSFVNVHRKARVLQNTRICPKCPAGGAQSPQLFFFWRPWGLNSGSRQVLLILEPPWQLKPTALIFSDHWKWIQVYFFLFGDWTQDLPLAMQMLFHINPWIQLCPHLPPLLPDESLLCGWILIKWKLHVEAESHLVPDSLLSSLLPRMERALKDGVTCQEG